MTKFNILVFFVLLIGFMMVCAAQQESLSPELKEAVARDAACTKAVDVKGSEPALTELTIRSGGRDVGTIVAVQNGCHCQGTNCDSLVYLRSGQGYRLALHEKYASLHPMKIVKLGMPSLTGQFEISPLKMETTVYDWDGKDYRPSLCATVIKASKVPTITRHPCKAASQ
jgi:hypothetical protein